MNKLFKRVIGTPLELENTEANQVANISQNNWTPELSESQISQIFDQGASLNIFLRPSDQISDRKNSETYLENYNLPVIWREAKFYMAMTDGHHAPPSSLDTVLAGSRMYYCYSNSGPGYYHTMAEYKETVPNVKIKVMNKVRYEEMSWIVKDTHELIFDGMEFRENPELVRAIKDGRNFRVSITLEDGKQFRLDLDLMYYYPGTKSSYGYSKSHFYPAIFSSLSDLHNSTIRMFAGEEGVFPVELNVEGDYGIGSTLFYINDDGTYSSIFMKARGEVAPYKNLKIFASK